MTPLVSHSSMFFLGMPIATSSSMQAMLAAPAPLTTSLKFLMSRPVSSSAFMQPGGGDDGGAVLVVVEDGDVEQLLQLLLDDEAVRRLDVLEVDAAEARAQVAHAVDDGLDVGRVDQDVDAVDVGEALEQRALALHHRLGRHARRGCRAPGWPCRWRRRPPGCPCWCSRRRAAGPAAMASTGTATPGE